MTAISLSGSISYIDSDGSNFNTSCSSLYVCNDQNGCDGHDGYNESLGRRLGGPVYHVCLEMLSNFKTCENQLQFNGIYNGSVCQNPKNPNQPNTTNPPSLVIQY